MIGLPSHIYEGMRLDVAFGFKSYICLKCHEIQILDFSRGKRIKPCCDGHYIISWPEVLEHKRTGKLFVICDTGFMSAKRWVEKR